MNIFQTTMWRIIYKKVLYNLTQRHSCHSRMISVSYEEQASPIGTSVCTCNAIEQLSLSPKKFKPKFFWVNLTGNTHKKLILNASLTAPIADFYSPMLSFFTSLSKFGHIAVQAMIYSQFKSMTLTACLFRSIHRYISASYSLQCSYVPKAGKGDVNGVQRN